MVAKTMAAFLTPAPPKNQKGKQKNDPTSIPFFGTFFFKSCRKENSNFFLNFFFKS